MASRVVIACTGLLLAAPALAMADTAKFNIPAQPLGAALRQFAEQAKMQLLYESGSVGNTVGSAIVGEMEKHDALELLLHDTGLEAVYSSESAATIRPSRARATSRTEPEVQAPPRDAPAASRKEDAASSRPESSSTSEPPADAGRETRGAATRLGEIVVTAQKRPERLIDAPQSVSVLTGDELSALGALQFRDFAETIPGMSFATFGAGQTQITLRGVTTGGDVSSTVGVYVDEVPFGSSTAFAQGSGHALDVGVFDIDRIEVLRGPQGTLYGASTMGGLIKYVTQRPDPVNFASDVRTGVSTTRNGDVGYNGSATVNVPLSEGRAALRIGGFYTHDSGYIDNVARDVDEVDRADIYGGRLDLLFVPTDALELRIGAFLQDISRDGQSTADYALGTSGNDSLEQIRPLPETFDQSFRLVSATVSYDFGPATLTSISSYQESRIEEFNDLSVFTFFCAFSAVQQCSALGTEGELPTDKFTQEIRLASDEEQRLGWVLGGFYTDEKSKNIAEFALRDLAGEPAPNDLGTTTNPSNFEERAVFGDLTWRFTDAFDVSGGLRYARNEQTYSQAGEGLFGLDAPETEATDNVSTYLANARYRFSDRAVGYLRFATGYRPGGPNIVSSATDVPSFEADRLKSYEAGFKAESADGRFGLDFASYYIDWSNIQVLIVQGGFGAYDNADGGATIRGAELTLSASPVPSLTLSGAFAYQDAELSEDEPQLGGAKGESLPNVPKATATLRADYSLSAGNWRPTVGATLRYVDDRSASFDQSVGAPQYELPDYLSVDMRASATFGRVDAQLFVRNVFDERGQLSARNTNLGTARVALLQPRTIGINLSMSF